MRFFVFKLVCLFWRSYAFGVLNGKDGCKLVTFDALWVIYTFLTSKWGSQHALHVTRCVYSLHTAGSYCSTFLQSLCSKSSCSYSAAPSCCPSAVILQPFCGNTSCSYWCSPFLQSFCSSTFLQYFCNKSSCSTFLQSFCGLNPCSYLLQSLCSTFLLSYCRPVVAWHNRRFNM